MNPVYIEEVVHDEPTITTAQLKRRLLKNPAAAYVFERHTKFGSGERILRILNGRRTHDIIFLSIEEQPYIAEIENDKSDTWVWEETLENAARLLETLTIFGDYERSSNVYAPRAETLLTPDQIREVLADIYKNDSPETPKEALR